MERTERIALLEQVRSGALSPAEAEALLAPPAFEDLGYAKVDHHRARRQKAAEVIFGQGKDPGQIEGIVRSMADRGAENILITRLSGEKEAALRGKFPYDYSAAACLAVAHPAPHPLTGAVAVVSAGTSDLAVCEEAALTAEALGSRVTRIYDAGVAGLPRASAVRAAWRGSTASWPTWRTWNRPGASWPWPGWRALCPAWWEGL